MVFVSGVRLFTTGGKSSLGRVVKSKPLVPDRLRQSFLGVVDTRDDALVLRGYRNVFMPLLQRNGDTMIEFSLQETEVLVQYTQ